MISSKACRPRGRKPSPQSRPSACIAFTTSNATGKLVIVAARCDMGVLLCVLGSSQLEYPFLALTQNPLRHPRCIRLVTSAERRLAISAECSVADRPLQVPLFEGFTRCEIK